ncbi:SigE family RNA polymerase sigma factor [Kribbella sp. VKM Ac-2566]|uniref:SigE family RNA polymerase sigma factor n=1 Tax=Kribbella sp. VKM Ac-2566 TaxID=2512218 RepID=UPI001064067C|nr:SigE family RNA polymerase sigma factor [Kribbella sp. VKM Ac-2566]TDX04001.1 RNA polymerase sigma-70 factor (sigma-E family) [Kribbella sp. VKM Ac-2566]
MTFEEWAPSQRGRLLGFATVLCGGPDLAEDVVQEVLLRVHSKWDVISRMDHPDAYIRRMLVNEFLSWRRKWARIEPHGVVEVMRAAPDHATAVADRMELLTQLCKLPKRQRAVIVLRYLCGQGDAEIAETLRCSPVTVRGYASRALATLRIQLTSDSLEGATYEH